MQPNTAMQPTPSVWPILILCGISGAVVSVMPLLFCRARLMASRWTATLLYRYDYPIRCILDQPISLPASLLHQDQNMSTDDQNIHRASVYAQLVSHIQTFFHGHRITERSVPATRVYERLP